MQIIQPSSAVSKYGPNFGYNIPNGLVNYKAQLANYATQQVRILCIGDSLSASGMTYPFQLKSYLQAKYNTSGDVWRGSAGSGVWNSTGGWNFSNNVGGYGGGGFVGAAGTGQTNNSMTFTGTGIDFHYRKLASGGGTADFQIDGVSKGTINCTGGLGTDADFNQRITVTGLTNASHTATIIPANNGIIEFTGALITNTTAGLSLNVTACTGAASSNFNQPGRVLNAWDLGPTYHLVVIQLAANDLHYVHTPSLLATNLPAYKTNMGAIINYWKNRGSDVLIVSWYRPSDTWAAMWPEIVREQYKLADQYNTALVDIYQAMGMSYELIANVYKYLGATPDPIHPADNTGHIHVARMIEPNVTL